MSSCRKKPGVRHVKHNGTVNVSVGIRMRAFVVQLLSSNTLNFMPLQLYLVRVNIYFACLMTVTLLLSELSWFYKCSSCPSVGKVLQFLVSACQKLLYCALLELRASKVRCCLSVSTMFCRLINLFFGLLFMNTSYAGRLGYKDDKIIPT